MRFFEDDDFEKLTKKSSKINHGHDYACEPEYPCEPEYGYCYPHDGCGPTYDEHGRPKTPNRF